MNCRALILLIPFCFTALLSVSVAIQDQQPKKIKRAKRPAFSERDTDGIFFKNLFKDGLVGERPSLEQLKQPVVAENGDAKSGPAPASGDSTWSKLIVRDVIEDEVKSQQQYLERVVTTPGKFKSDYGSAHKAFSTLSIRTWIPIRFS